MSLADWQQFLKDKGYGQSVRMSAQGGRLLTQSNLVARGATFPTVPKRKPQGRMVWRRRFSV